MWEESESCSVWSNMNKAVTQSVLELYCFENDTTVCIHFQVFVTYLWLTIVTNYK